MLSSKGDYRRQYAITDTLQNMLIVLGGLPGVGKTRIARAFSKAASAVHVRIDSIEQAICQSGVTVVSQDDAG